MSKRKTLDVEDLINTINHVLRTHVGSIDHRKGVQNTIEYVLHKTGNYKGFRYLTNDEVPAGELPGVRYSDDGILPYPERFENTDSTRVQY